MASPSPTATADVRHDWVYRFDSDDAKHCEISYAHMCNLEAFTHDGEAILAAAFQCSAAGAEGGDSQHIRFATSRDGGKSWTDAKCVVWGLNALWSPILHYHNHRSGSDTHPGAAGGGGGGGGELFMFYTESRKARSPGGDVKCITSLDAGARDRHVHTNSTSPKLQSHLHIRPTRCKYEASLPTNVRLCINPRVVCRVRTSLLSRRSE